jgi:hypothetical protein
LAIVPLEVAEAGVVAEHRGEPGLLRGFIRSVGLDPCPIPSDT